MRYDVDTAALRDDVSSIDEVLVRVQRLGIADELTPVAAALPGSRCGAALRRRRGGVDGPVGRDALGAAGAGAIPGSGGRLLRRGRARSAAERRTIVRRLPVTVAGGSLTLSVRDIRASRPQS